MIGRRKWTGASAVAIVLLASAAGCRPEQEALRFSGAPVVIISIDTLRSDRLPVYGYRGVQTPHIDALAADSVRFERAWTHVPMTLPAHVSMLTGLLPPDHGVRNNLGYRFNPSAHPSLTRALKKEGYASAAAVTSFVLRADTGFGALFDDYFDSIPAASGDATGTHQRDGASAVADAMGWIEPRREQPFLFLLHLYEPHAPYDPPEPHRSRYRDAYDGEVARSDEIVGEFLKRLKELGIYDRAIIVLTSDHGEGLGDHGEDQHGILLYREALQIPLLIKLPGGRSANQSRSDHATLADLAPTLARLAGAEMTAGPHSRDLFRGENTPRTVYAETLYPRIHLGWSELRSLIEGDRHFIDAPRPELFDLNGDPAERNNLAEQERRELARFRGLMERYPDPPVELGEINPEVARKLAALGYISAPASADAEGERPNPIDRIHDLATLRDAFSAAEARDYARAEALLRTVLEKSPDSLDAWDKLGEVLLNAGRYAEAAQVYRQAIQRFPNLSGPLVLSLGFVNLAAGDLADAEASARAALQQNPSKGRELLARVALAREQFDAAERELEAALAPGHGVPALLILGAEIAQRRGDDPNAVLRKVEDAERAARAAGIESVRHLEFLRADSLARLNRPVEAQAALEREIARYPENLQAYANLAVVQFLMGDAPLARRTIAQLVERNPTPKARSLAAQTREALGL